MSTFTIGQRLLITPYADEDDFLRPFIGQIVECCRPDDEENPNRNLAWVRLPNGFETPIAPGDVEVVPQQLTPDEYQQIQSVLQRILQLNPHGISTP